MYNTRAYPKRVQHRRWPPVVAALALIAHGLDFADALHLSSRPAGAAFASFDKSFVSRANRAGASKVSVP